MKIKLFVVISSLFVSGCASPFAQFYFDKTGGLDITKKPYVILSNDTPKIFRGSDLNIDYQRMLEDGYGLVGYSSFNAGNVNENDAISQAKKVHASVVLIYSRYTNTVSGVVPLTLPDTQTSSTNVYGNVYGPGGSGSFSGRANTTTYGTRTTYMPYSVNRSDYFASYWIKMKTPILGVVAAELTPELRQKIGSNKGVLVIAVMKNSPAFMADILKGDILKKIEDTEIIDPKSFSETVHLFEGKKVNILIIRDDKEIPKEVMFNKMI
jgi:hypothetical protein